MSNFEYFGGVEGYFYFFLQSHLLCDQKSWYDRADTPYFIHHNLIFYMSLVFATRILRFRGLSAHNKVHVCDYEFTLLQSSSGQHQKGRRCPKESREICDRRLSLHSAASLE